MNVIEMVAKRVRVLLVEGSGRESLREDVLRCRADDLRVARSIPEAEAITASWAPSLVLLDLDLDREAALSWLSSPIASRPGFVVMSATATAEESFRLAQLGVRSYLQKPIRQEALAEALRVSLEHPPDLSPHLRAVVGFIPIHEIERTARRTMMNEALARSRGSKTGAAKLLCISRQLLQHMMRGQKRAC